MGTNYGKKDRTARLLKLQMLLSQHPKGMTPAELAIDCSVSKRTVYRDINTLEHELDVPLWIDHGTYGVAEGYFLSPVVFSPEEAINIFLAIRLMQNLSYHYNPSIASTFKKLSTIVPTPLRNKIQNTLDFMKKQPVNEKKIEVFNGLIQAWLAQHCVKINYLEKYGAEAISYTIEPYFIEPSILGHSSYVIGYCREQDRVRGFKVNSIIGDVSVSEDTYQIPSDFDAANHLSSEWDVYYNEELVTVRLQFNAKTSNSVMETTWHPSQEIEKLADGSAIMTFKVRDTTYFRAFVLGFGDDVEVLEPEELRQQMAEIARGLATMYYKRGTTNTLTTAKVAKQRKKRG